MKSDEIRKKVNNIMKTVKEEDSELTSLQVIIMIAYMEECFGIEFEEEKYDVDFFVDEDRVAQYVELLIK